MTGCVLSYLKFDHEEWAYHSAPRPQYKGYLAWLKGHVARKHPVVMFIFCKGDSHRYVFFFSFFSRLFILYNIRSHGGEPGYGNYDHIEPVFGIVSSHSLDPNSSSIDEYYEDDVLMHHSDWNQLTYFRTFKSMPDTPQMDGNCKNVEPRGGGPNEAHPCIPEDVDYGFQTTAMNT